MAVGGLTSFGFSEIALNKDIDVLRKAAENVVKVEKSFLKFTGSSGYMSKGLQETAVAHIKSAIATNGGNLTGYSNPYRTDPVWEKMKAKEKLMGAPYMATGSLLNSIKVLNRRSSGGRFTTVGIDQKLTVPKLGSRAQKTTSNVSVAAYAYDLEFGTTSGKPRLLITTAMADFIYKIAGPMAKDLVADYAKGAWSQVKSDDKLAAMKIIREHMVANGIRSEDTTEALSRISGAS